MKLAIAIIAALSVLSFAPSISMANDVEKCLHGTAPHAWYNDGGYCSIILSTDSQMAQANGGEMVSYVDQNGNPVPAGPNGSPPPAAAGITITRIVKCSTSGATTHTFTYVSHNPPPGAVNGTVIVMHTNSC